MLHTEYDLIYTVIESESVMQQTEQRPIFNSIWIWGVTPIATWHAKYAERVGKS